MNEQAGKTHDAVALLQYSPQCATVAAPDNKAKIQERSFALPSGAQPGLAGRNAVCLLEIGTRIFGDDLQCCLETKNIPMASKAV